MRLLPCLLAMGTTPARAGTTTGGPCHGLWTGDHPRTRGDHRSAVAFQKAVVGPPPHARGPQASTWDSTRTHPRFYPLPQIAT